MSHFKLISFSCIVAFAAFFTSCGEDPIDSIDKSTNLSSKAPFQIRLTDAPGDYQQVNIYLLRVSVQKLDSSWIDLPTNAGRYDLLTLQNGLDSMIVNDSLAVGTKIAGLRLVLGDSNTIMVDSMMHNLKVPSGSSSGFKVKFSDTLEADGLNILLDFDADKSVVKNGNETYLLKPVVKVL